MNPNNSSEILTNPPIRPALPLSRVPVKVGLRPDRSTAGAGGRLAWQHVILTVTAGLDATTDLAISALGAGLVEFSVDVFEPNIVSTYTGFIASVGNTYEGLIASVADTYEGLIASLPLLQRWSYQLAKNADDMTRLIGNTYTQGVMDIPELAGLMGPRGEESDIALLLEENGFHRTIAANTLSDNERLKILAGLADLVASGTADQYNTDDWTKREVIASQRIESIYVDPAALAK